MSPETKEVGSRYRAYSLGEVLFFATGGRLCSPIHQRDIQPLLAMCAYMIGEPNADVHMLEAGGIAMRCQEAVLEQHPHLKAIAEKFETGETEAIFQTCNGDMELWHQKLDEWLDAQQDEPGKLLPLIPLPDFERDPRSIPEQAVEAAGSHAHKLLLATADEEGNIVFPE